MVCVYISRNLLLSRLNDEHCLFIVACVALTLTLGFVHLEGALI